MPAILDALLPHRPPMQWIQGLTSWTDTTATATVCFDNAHFAMADGAIMETSLVECVAQTVAAGLAQRARAAGKAPGASQGMLAAVTRFCIHLTPPLGKILTIETVEIRRLGPMLLIAGKIKCGEEIIAAGELSLYG